MEENDVENQEDNVRNYIPMMFLFTFGKESRRIAKIFPLRKVLIFRFHFSTSLLCIASILT